jgi:hypothetical protein
LGRVGQKSKACRQAVEFNLRTIKKQTKGH